MADIRRNYHGSHVLAAALTMAVVLVIGFAGWRVLVKATSKKTPATNSSTATPTTSQNSANPTSTEYAFVDWSFNDETWVHQSEAPACESQLSIGAPMDLSLATSVLYPGQVRGGDYKPHGGIGIDSASDTQLTVYAVRDAYLYRGARYIEAGEVQHLLDFIDPCGILVRYDHLATLSAELQQYVDQLPAAQPDDSRTHRFAEPVLIKKGTVLATSAGFSATKNAFFDLGVYDLRSPNEQSKTELFKTDPLRVGDKEQSYFSVCWFDLLEEPGKSKVATLPPRGGAKEATSDYCTR